jgi:UDP-glucose 4-epimerase
VKIAVTGGAGFIGSNLVKRLLELNHEIIIVDDLSTGLEENLIGLECEFHNISVLDEYKLSKVMASCDAIFHFAARGSVPRSINNPIKTYQVNLSATLNILEIARKNSAHVIYSSSSSVYGRNLIDPKIEETWLAPISPYAASKLSSEAFLMSYANSYDLPITIFRFFNVYGPFQRPDHNYAAVIPKWILQALRGEEIQVYGDGEQMRDFTYIDTVTQVASSALSRIASHGEIINLAYGETVSLNNIVSKLKKEFPLLSVSYLPPRQGDIKNSRNQPEKIKHYFPEVDPIQFDVGFKKTLNWLKNNFS